MRENIFLDLKRTTNWKKLGIGLGNFADLDWKLKNFEFFAIFRWIRNLIHKFEVNFHIAYAKSCVQNR